MARPRRGDVVDVDIVQVDEKGQGIGFLNDYTVRVRGGIPGDVVQGYIRKIQNRRREIDVRKTALVDSTKKRIVARCEHFGICGGCSWQDVVYGDQVEIKQQLVQNCLDSAGVDLKLDQPLIMDAPFYYRNKMEFSFGTSDEGQADLGLHVPGRFDHVFDLRACHLQSELSNQIVDFVRQFVRDRNLSVYHLKRHEGLLRFLTIREGKNTDEMMVILTTSGEDFREVKELAMEVGDQFPGVKCFVHSINSRKAQVAFGEEEVALLARDHIFEKLGPFTFEISPSSFFQTNTHQAGNLYERVVELAAPQREDRVLDLYCGMGAISFFLSRLVDNVLGIEISAAAVQDAVRNSARNGISNCAFMAGPAEELMGQLTDQSERFDLVITDPPRVGMHPKAMDALVKLRPKKIVYVSCNPKALGQDLKVLCEAGYLVDYGQLVDMFPHTPHCEVLVRLIDTQ